MSKHDDRVWMKKITSPYINRPFYLRHHIQNTIISPINKTKFGERKHS